MTVSFFLEMGWKSALISAAALGLVALLRSRSAADRAAVLQVAVAMLLLLPLIAWGLPALEVEAWAAEAEAAAFVPTPELLTYLPAAAAAEVTPPTIWDDPTSLFAILYGGGLAMALLRLIAGLWTLHRWTAAAEEVRAPAWRVAFARVGAAMPSRRPVRLLVSGELYSPLSWGWRRPVILIDPDTLAMEEDADAILAHEMAHIVRHDWPTLMLARHAAALFWFNPLVWLVEREAVQQAEEAADQAAARSVEPARYAQTLVTWAQFGQHGLPANSMAPATPALARRVRAILDERMRSLRSGSRGASAAMVGCALFAGLLAALELVPGAAQARARPMPEPAPAPAAAPAEVPAEAPAAIAAAVSPQDVRPQPRPRVRPAPAAGAAPEAPPTPEAAAPPAPPAVERIVKLMGPPSRPAPHVAVRVDVRAAEAQRQGRHSVVVPQQRIDHRRIEREVERSLHQAERSRTVGLRSIEHGADQMERGAAAMARTAQRFRDPAERERAIAEARVRGETLTHEQLIEAADGLEEGARELRRGAEEMRASATAGIRRGS